MIKNGITVLNRTSTVHKVIEGRNSTTVNVNADVRSERKIEILDANLKRRRGHPYVSKIKTKKGSNVQREPVNPVKDEKNQIKLNETALKHCEKIIALSLNILECNGIKRIQGMERRIYK